MKKKLGFLYLDQSYAVYHSISLAIALSRNPDYDIVLLCTASNSEAISNIVKPEELKNITIQTIRPYWHVSLPHYLEIKLQYRKMIFWRYKALFESFDGLVTTIYNDLELKKYLKESAQPYFIFCNHGVSNREYSFSNKIKAFDLFFLIGQNELVERQRLNQLQPGNHRLIGYLKYEYLRNRKKLSLFKNNRPTIIYNPHWTKDLSSFYKFGFQILDFFTNSEKYNLIFAPHTLLTTRNKSIELRLRKYADLPNMIIDNGTEYANDLSYINAADLYLGDVSSQALEFILCKKRPCLFLDACNIQDSGEQIISWQFGKVFNHVDNLDQQLEEVFMEHQQIYEALQSKEIVNIFSNTDTESGLLPSKVASTALNQLFHIKEKGQ